VSRSLKLFVVHYDDKKNPSVFELKSMDSWSDKNVS